MNLYLVKTSTFSSYVIAETMNEAAERFKNWLGYNNYGAFWERDAVTVTIVAKEDAKPKSEYEEPMSPFDQLLICDKKETIYIPSVSVPEKGDTTSVYGDASSAYYPDDECYQEEKIK